MGIVHRSINREIRASSVATRYETETMHRRRKKMSKCKAKGRVLGLAENVLTRNAPKAILGRKSKTCADMRRG